MELHLGADVRGREDEKLGDLRRVVIDPETREVVSLVIRHSGFDGRDLVVPIGSLDSASHDGVRLEFDRDQFDTLPDFADSHNVAPPPTADNLASEEHIAPEEIPDVPPIGAATGIESIAFIPVIQEDTQVLDRDDVIDGDTLILATDEELGRISYVRLDEQTHRITDLAVEKGLIFKHEVMIPMDWVTHVRPGAVVLGVDGETARQFDQE